MNNFNKLHTISIAFMQNFIKDNQTTRQIKERYLLGEITLEQAVALAKGDD